MLALNTEQGNRTTQELKGARESLQKRRDKVVREDGTVGTKGVRGCCCNNGMHPLQALQALVYYVAAVAKDEYAQRNY